MCEVCDISSCGTSPVYLGKTGWIFAIKKDEFNHYSIVVNHNGDQDEFSIAFCPECGRELKNNKGERKTK